MTNLWIATLLIALNIQYGFKWVSFNMIKRTSARGKTTRVDARVHFHTNGDMVTYLSEPTEIFLLNNSQGELQVYNPEENSVFRSVNYNYSSQNSNFYYFLGQVPNMGLDKVGYKISGTKIDEGVMVTTWVPPKELQADIDRVEVVDDGERIIFMGFLDDEDQYFKKIYFYDFTDLRGVDFPKSITEIDYLKEDSIITKTSFHDFQFDDYRDKELLEFKVPENARLIK